MRVRGRGLAVAVAILLAVPSVAVAQTSPSPASTDVTGHLPSGTWLLVVLGLGLAAYISYRLGHARQGGPRRRQGPISKALDDPRRGRD